MAQKTLEVASPSASTRPETTLVPFAYRKGDILLRAGTEAWIQEITQGLYSHAGICVDPDKELAADAHPVDGYRSADHEVAEVPIHYFFNVEHAPGGGDVFRGSDVDAAAKAAEWARQQNGKQYTFDLMDPILGADGKEVENNKLYCSEFVWRSYVKGAGVRLVQEAEFTNLLSKENQDRTVEELLPQAREALQVPNWVPDFIVRKKLLAELKKRHNGWFVSPSQLAKARGVRHVHAVRGGAVKAADEQGKKGSEAQGEQRKKTG